MLILYTSPLVLVLQGGLYLLFYVMKRKQDVRTGYLENLEIILRWASRKFDIKTNDILKLFYVRGKGKFVRTAWRDEFEIFYSDATFYRIFIKDGWIEKLDERKDGLSLYCISKKGRLLLTKIEKRQLRMSLIPDSKMRNHIMCGRTYMDRRLVRAIDRFNKSF